MEDIKSMNEKMGYTSSLNEKSLFNKKVETTNAFLKQQIFVYQLVDWRILSQNSKTLKLIFYNALGLNINQSSTNFLITPISGFLKFTDASNLKNSTPNGKIYTDEDLIKIVNQFIKKLSIAHLNYSKQNQSFKIPFYFQTNPTFSNISPVYAENNQIIRWIIQYNITLPFSNTKKNSTAIVKNSLFEIVIDCFGKVNSILLRWKPIEKKINSNLINKETIKKVISVNENTTLKPSIKQLSISGVTNRYSSKFISIQTIAQTSEDESLIEFIHSNYLPEEHHREHSDEEEPEGEPTVQYVLAGDNTFQSHLSPYLVIPSGHHAKNVSIIKHGLDISFQKTPSSQNVKIEAVVTGGSGNYKYSWACWEISQKENYLDLGNSNYCTILGGSFQVLITVVDNVYGIVKQFQEFVYANQPVEMQFKQNENLIRYGCTNSLAKNYNPNANCDDGTCQF